MTILGSQLVKTRLAAMLGIEVLPALFVSCFLRVFRRRFTAPSPESDFAIL